LAAAPVEVVRADTFEVNTTGDQNNLASRANIITNENTNFLQIAIPANVDCGLPIAIAADADSWIDQNSATSNFALDGVLKVQSKAGGNSRALVHFLLPVVPDGCTLGSAMLYVYAASAALDRVLGVIPLAGDWVEETVTWSNQPAMTGTAITAVSDFEVRRWDVTSHVQTMYAAGQNHGFLIRDMAENGSGSEQQFVSRENAEDGPELLIRFISAVPLDPTSPDTLITTAPVELTLENSASFSFSGSDDLTPSSELAFQCRLDSQAEDDFLDCVSPVTYQGLTPGDHSFEVRALDRENKTDLTPASFPWTVLPPGGGSGEAVPRTVTCGQVLTSSTRVLNHLSECPEDGLVIGAHGILIDLNGRIIDGVGLGIGIRNDGFHSVTVRNGTVQEFDYGVRLSAGSKFNIITSLTVQNNQVTGIELIDDGTYGNQVRNSSVAGNADGIELLDGAEATVVLQNTLSNNSGIGLYLRASNGNLLGSNTIGVGSNAGILLEGASKNILFDNALQSAGDGGVLVTLGSDGNRLRNNAVSGTSDAGFVVEGSNSNQLIGNTVTETGDSGFALKDSHGNQLIGNTAHDNSDSGISLDSANDNVLRNNDVRFNPGGIELGGSSRNLIETNEANLTTGNGIELGPESYENLVQLNRANGNSAQGISVGEDAPEGLGNIIERNEANDNGGGGIYVGKGGSIVRGNIAHNNRGWGIYAADTRVDGGGNLAIGNAEPLQCFNVICNAIPTPTATPSPMPTDSSMPPTVTQSPTPTTVPTNTQEPSSATPTLTTTFEVTETSVLPTDTEMPTGTSEPPAETETATSTVEPTETPVPPTITNIPTDTPEPPTATHTSAATVAPTATTTPTETLEPPTATHTSTATVTSTETPVPPTATTTSTNTPVPPTSTHTSTASFTATLEPTATATSTPQPTSTHTPTITFTATSTATATFTATSTATPMPTLTSTLTLTPSLAQSLTFTPAADASLYLGSPNTNFGSVNSLETDGNPAKNFLIKFVVSGIDDRQVTSAKLRLFNVNSSNYGGDFHRVVNNTWQEGTVTWNNAPAADSIILASLGSVSSGGWYEVDLTSFITADGTYSLWITSPSSNGADYSSKEGNNPPQLILNLVGGAIATDTPTAAATSTLTPTPTATSSATPTATATFTATDTATPSPTSTNTLTPTPSQAESLTFIPAADASLYLGSPSTNFGWAISLETDGSPVKHFLVKFVVIGIDGRQVTSAKLRLFNVNSSSYGGDFRRVMDDAWQEGTASWNNAPSADSDVLVSLGRVSAGTWYEVDITSFISADGTYSLRITSPSTNGADYSSREGSNPPQLIIDVAAGVRLLRPNQMAR